MPSRGNRAGALVEPAGQFALRGLDGIRAVNEVSLHPEPRVATGAREGEGEVVLEGVTGGDGPGADILDVELLSYGCAGLPQPGLVSSDDWVGCLDESDGTQRDSRNMRPRRPGR